MIFLMKRNDNFQLYIEHQKINSVAENNYNLIFLKNTLFKKKNHYGHYQTFYYNN